MWQIDNLIAYLWNLKHSESCMCFYQSLLQPTTTEPNIEEGGKNMQLSSCTIFNH